MNSIKNLARVVSPPSDRNLKLFQEFVGTIRSFSASKIIYSYKRLKKPKTSDTISNIRMGHKKRMQLVRNISQNETDFDEDVVEGIESEDLIFQKYQTHRSVDDLLGGVDKPFPKSWNDIRLDLIRAEQMRQKEDDKKLKSMKKTQVKSEEKEEVKNLQPFRHLKVEEPPPKKEKQSVQNPSKQKWILLLGHDLDIRNPSIKYCPINFSDDLMPIKIPKAKTESTSKVTKVCDSRQCYIKQENTNFQSAPEAGIGDLRAPKPPKKNKLAMILETGKIETPDVPGKLNKIISPRKSMKTYMSYEKTNRIKFPDESLLRINSINPVLRTPMPSTLQTISMKKSSTSLNEDTSAFSKSNIKLDLLDLDNFSREKKPLEPNLKESNLMTPPASALLPIESKGEVAYFKFEESLNQKDAPSETRNDDRSNQYGINKESIGLLVTDTNSHSDEEFDHDVVHLNPFSLIDMEDMKPEAPQENTEQNAETIKVSKEDFSNSNQSVMEAKKAPEVKIESRDPRHIKPEKSSMETLQRTLWKKKAEKRPKKQNVVLETYDFDMMKCLKSLKKMEEKKQNKIPLNPFKQDQSPESALKEIYKHRIQADLRRNTKHKSGIKTRLNRGALLDQSLPKLLFKAKRLPDSEQNEKPNMPESGFVNSQLCLEKSSELPFEKPYKREAPILVARPDEESQLNTTFIVPGGESSEGQISCKQNIISAALAYEMSEVTKECAKEEDVEPLGSKPDVQSEFGNEVFKPLIGSEYYLGSKPLQNDSETFSKSNLDFDIKVEKIDPLEIIGSNHGSQYWKDFFIRKHGTKQSQKQEINPSFKMHFFNETDFGELFLNRAYCCSSLIDENSSIVISFDKKGKAKDAKEKSDDKKSEKNKDKKPNLKLSKVKKPTAAKAKIKTKRNESRMRNRMKTKNKGKSNQKNNVRHKAGYVVGDSRSQNIISTAKFIDCVKSYNDMFYNYIKTKGLNHLKKHSAETIEFIKANKILPKTQRDMSEVKQVMEIMKFRENIFSNSFPFLKSPIKGGKEPKEGDKVKVEILKNFICEDANKNLNKTCEEDLEEKSENALKQAEVLDLIEGIKGKMNGEKPMAVKNDKSQSDKRKLRRKSSTEKGLNNALECGTNDRDKTQKICGLRPRKSSRNLNQRNKKSLEAGKERNQKMKTLNQPARTVTVRTSIFETSKKLSSENEGEAKCFENRYERDGFPLKSSEEIQNNSSDDFDSEFFATSINRKKNDKICKAFPNFTEKHSNPIRAKKGLAKCHSDGRILESKTVLIEPDFSTGYPQKTNLFDDFAENGKKDVDFDRDLFLDLSENKDLDEMNLRKMALIDSPREKSFLKSKNSEKLCLENESNNDKTAFNTRSFKSNYLEGLEQKREFNETKNTRSVSQVERNDGFCCSPEKFKAAEKKPKTLNSEVEVIKIKSEHIKDHEGNYVMYNIRPESPSSPYEIQEYKEIPKEMIFKEKCYDGHDDDNDDKTKIKFNSNEIETFNEDLGDEFVGDSTRISSNSTKRFNEAEENFASLCFKKDSLFRASDISEENTCNKEQEGNILKRCLGQGKNIDENIDNKRKEESAKINCHIQDQKFEVSVRNQETAGMMTRSFQSQNQKQEKNALNNGQNGTDIKCFQSQDEKSKDYDLDKERHANVIKDLQSHDFANVQSQNQNWKDNTSHKQKVPVSIQSSQSRCLKNEIEKQGETFQFPHKKWEEGNALNKEKTAELKYVESPEENWGQDPREKAESKISNKRQDESIPQQMLSQDQKYIDSLLNKKQEVPLTKSQTIEIEFQEDLTGKNFQAQDRKGENLSKKINSSYKADRDDSDSVSISNKIMNKNCFDADEKTKANFGFKPSMEESSITKTVFTQPQDSDENFGIINCNDSLKNFSFAHQNKKATTVGGETLEIGKETSSNFLLGDESGSSSFGARENFLNSSKQEMSSENLDMVNIEIRKPSNTETSSRALAGDVLETETDNNESFSSKATKEESEENNLSSKTNSINLSLEQYSFDRSESMASDLEKFPNENHLNHGDAPGETHSPKKSVILSSMLNMDTLQRKQTTPKKHKEKESLLQILGCTESEKKFHEELLKSDDPSDSSSTEFHHLAPVRKTKENRLYLSSDSDESIHERCDKPKVSPARMSKLINRAYSAMAKISKNESKTKLINVPQDNHSESSTSLKEKKIKDKDMTNHQPFWTLENISSDSSVNAFPLDNLLLVDEVIDTQDLSNLNVLLSSGSYLELKEQRNILRTSFKNEPAIRRMFSDTLSLTPLHDSEWICKKEIVIYLATTMECFNLSQRLGLAMKSKSPSISNSLVPFFGEFSDLDLNDGNESHLKACILKDAEIQKILPKFKTNSKYVSLENLLALHDNVKILFLLLCGKHSHLQDIVSPQESLSLMPATESTRGDNEIKPRIWYTINISDLALMGPGFLKVKSRREKADEEKEKHYSKEGKLKAAMLRSIADTLDHSDASSSFSNKTHRARPPHVYRSCLKKESIFSPRNSKKSKSSGRLSAKERFIQAMQNQQDKVKKSPAPVLKKSSQDEESAWESNPPITNVPILLRSNLSGPLHRSLSKILPVKENEIKLETPLENKRPLESHSISSSHKSGQKTFRPSNLETIPEITPSNPSKLDEESSTEKLSLKKKPDKSMEILYKSPRPNIDSSSQESLANKTITPLKYKQFSSKHSNAARANLSFPPFFSSHLVQSSFEDKPLKTENNEISKYSLFGKAFTPRSPSYREKASMRITSSSRRFLDQNQNNLEGKKSHCAGELHQTNFHSSTLLKMSFASKAASSSSSVFEEAISPSFMHISKEGTTINKNIFDGCLSEEVESLVLKIENSVGDFNTKSPSDSYLDCVSISSKSSLEIDFHPVSSCELAFNGSHNQEKVSKDDLGASTCYESCSEGSIRKFLYDKGKPSSQIT